MRALPVSIAMSAAGIAVNAYALATPDLPAAQEKMAAMSVPFVPNAGNGTSRLRSPRGRLRGRCL